MPIYVTNAKEIVIPMINVLEISDVSKETEMRWFQAADKELLLDGTIATVQSMTSVQITAQLLLLVLNATGIVIQMPIVLQA